MNSVEWNPKHNFLAYAGDDKNKYQADEGISDALQFKEGPRVPSIFLKIKTSKNFAGVFRVFGFESA